MTDPGQTQSTYHITAFCSHYRDIFCDEKNFVQAEQYVDWICQRIQNLSAISEDIINHYPDLVGNDGLPDLYGKFNLMIHYHSHQEQRN